MQRDGPAHAYIYTYIHTISSLLFSSLLISFHLISSLRSALEASKLSKMMKNSRCGVWGLLGFGGASPRWRWRWRWNDGVGESRFVFVMDGSIRFDYLSILSFLGGFLLGVWIWIWIWM